MHSGRVASSNPQQREVLLAEEVATMDHFGYTARDVRCAQSPRLLRLPMSSQDRLEQRGHLRLHLQHVHLIRC